MANRTSRVPNEDQELNLAPIMNMVIILIPLLLLSVVFVSVSVINITTPSLGPLPDKTSTEKPWMLTVALDYDGFYVSTVDGVLPPVAGCKGKASICLEDQSVDTQKMFSDAAIMIQQGQRARGEAVLNHAMRAYNWRQLYNTLSAIKKERQDKTTINISASPRIPYAAVVRTFDVARHKLQKQHYDSSAAFQSANPKKGDKSRYESLFDAPTISVVQ